MIVWWPFCRSPAASQAAVFAAVNDRDGSGIAAVLGWPPQQVVIPPRAVHRLRLKPGDHLRFEARDGRARRVTLAFRS